MTGFIGELIRPVMTVVAVVTGTYISYRTDSIKCILQVLH
jgi:hypothetical protein